jgi:hypothetical protein
VESVGGGRGPPRVGLARILARTISANQAEGLMAVPRINSGFWWRRRARNCRSQQLPCPSVTPLVVMPLSTADTDYHSFVLDEVLPAAILWVKYGHLIPFQFRNSKVRPQPDCPHDLSSFDLQGSCNNMRRYGDG